MGFANACHWCVTGMPPGGRMWGRHGWHPMAGFGPHGNWAIWMPHGIGVWPRDQWVIGVPPCWPVLRMIGAPPCGRFLPLGHKWLVLTTPVVGDSVATWWQVLTLLLGVSGSFPWQQIVRETWAPPGGWFLSKLSMGGLDRPLVAGIEGFT